MLDDDDQYKPDWPADDFHPVLTRLMNIILWVFSGVMTFEIFRSVVLALQGH